MSSESAAFRDLHALGREEALEAGRYLWREGDQGDEVVLLVDGVLDVVREPFWQLVERVRNLTGRVTQTYRAAITDALTGLYIFGFFRERLALEVDRAGEGAP